MSRARRRADELDTEKRMDRIARDGWRWGPEYRKQHAKLLKKLAHNPKACGGHCCNWTAPVKGDAKRKQAALRDALES